jgi:osmoprotectant transport system ATP-binding protein
MIEFRAVSKIYGSTPAIQTVDLTIQAEKTTAVIGPSGCGKSTLLRLIIGLIQADYGSVYLNDVRILPENVLFIRRKMGYVCWRRAKRAEYGGGGSVPT